MAATSGKRGNPHKLRPNVKGQPRRGGRAKGTQNKITVSMKEAFLNAFNGIGGEAALIAWAKKTMNKKSFFQMTTKLIPTELVGKDGADLISGTSVKIYLPDNKRPALTDGNKKP